MIYLLALLCGANDMAAVASTMSHGWKHHTHVCDPPGARRRFNIKHRLAFNMEDSTYAGGWGRHAPNPRSEQ